MPGATGTPGLPGRDGASGKDGMQGSIGAPGTPGTCPSTCSATCNQNLGETPFDRTYGPHKVWSFWPSLVPSIHRWIDWIAKMSDQHVIDLLVQFMWFP